MKIHAIYILIDDGELGEKLEKYKVKKDIL